ncbi:MAG: 1-deoxy-D-xylulose-5-phosphate reductoisomerase [Ruminococcaceae bacterium]|nr:1-deoxy-D-xylulose-5-phosphate reductoisomerase [Oscillospiraceae bacterium]
MKKLSLLGSTGSIGTQTIDVVRMLKDKGEDSIELCGIAAHSNVKLLEQQIREFKPQYAAVFDLNAAKDLKDRIKDTSTKVLTGKDGLCEVASLEESDVVLNSVTGMVGLFPTIAALSSGKPLALANKESMVTGGAIACKIAKEKNLPILPVDSEHSAIFQCMQGTYKKEQIQRLILTASGGPFFGKTLEELKAVTPEMALKHPNWNMGARVTIDSATMFNKGLEIMEAKWLFDTELDNIDVVVHRESVIHSLIEYCDNSVIAQLGVPDMRIPIQYALTYPNRYPSPVKRLNLQDYTKLTFYPADEKTFKCLASCKEALRRGGLAPAAINGADEEAVKLFLNKKISFTDIGDIVTEAMNNQPHTDNITVEGIIEADKRAREFVISEAQKM